MNAVLLCVEDEVEVEGGGNGSNGSVIYCQSRGLSEKWRDQDAEIPAVQTHLKHACDHLVMLSGTGTSPTTPMRL